MVNFLFCETWLTFENLGSGLMCDPAEIVKWKCVSITWKNGWTENHTGKRRNVDMTRGTGEVINNGKCVMSPLKPVGSTIPKPFGIKGPEEMYEQAGRTRSTNQFKPIEEPNNLEARDMTLVTLDPPSGGIKGPEEVYEQAGRTRSTNQFKPIEEPNNLEARDMTLVTLYPPPGGVTPLNQTAVEFLLSVKHHNKYYSSSQSKKVGYSLSAKVKLKSRPMVNHICNITGCIKTALDWTGRCSIHSERCQLPGSINGGSGNYKRYNTFGYRKGAGQTDQCLAHGSMSYDNINMCMRLIQLQTDMRRRQCSLLLDF